MKAEYLVSSLATGAVFLAVAGAAWGEEAVTQPWTQTGTTGTQGGNTNCVAVSPDGKQVVIGYYESKDGTVIVYDEKGNKIKELKFPIGSMGEIANIQYTADGKTIYGYDVRNKRVVAWNAETGEFLGEVAKGSDGGPIALNPACAGIKFPATTPTLTPRPSVTPSPTPSAAAKPVLTVEGTGGGVLDILDENGRVIGQVRVAGSGDLVDAEFSPDGSFIVVTYNNGMTCVVKQINGKWVCQKLPGTFTSPSGVTGTSVDISDDGKMIAAGGVSGIFVWEWDQKAKKWVIVFQTKTPGYVSCVEFIDGKVAAAGGTGVSIWDPIAKTCVATLDTPTVKDITVSPDGNTLYVATSDGVKVFTRSGATPTPTPASTPTPAPTPKPSPSTTPTPTPKLPTSTPDPSMVQVNTWPY